MAKIGIISTFGYMEREINYGSLFQYYALQEHLKEIGHNPFWIRYYGKYFSIYVRNKTNLGFYSSGKNEKYTSKKQCRKELSKFCKKHLNLSGLAYFAGTKIIRIIPPKADIYITGSDKVLGMDPIQYLSFAPEKKKRYAYAASCPEGLVKFDSDKAALLRAFDGLSVREAKTIDMCREVGCNGTVQVLDPTLLISKEHYLSFTVDVEPEKSPYIMGYFGSIGNSSQDYCQVIHSYTDNAAEDFIIVPIENRGIEPIFPDNRIMWPSPDKWLRLFSEASTILTDSFHGTIFSVIMQRPFLSIIPEDRPSRPIQSFLESLGLEDRIVRRNDVDLGQKMSRPIDWEKTDLMLDVLLKQSKGFLKSIS